MRKAVKHRLTSVEQMVGHAPISDALVENAFAHFRATGDLPEQQRFAAAVVERTMQHGVTPAKPGTLAENLERLRICAANISDAFDSPPVEPSVRELLFHEAVYGQGIVKGGARVALCAVVECGLNITDPLLLSAVPLPDHAGVGLHLLGYPERLAKPPYVERAQRLFARSKVLRDRIDQDDPKCLQSIEGAALAFRDCGELPEDVMLREAVLVDAELHALMRHAAGEDVGDEVAGLERVAAYALSLVPK